MPRLYVDPSRFWTAKLELSGGDAHYVGEVLRLNVGDELSLFDGKGHEAIAQIQARQRGRLTLRVGPLRRAPDLAMPRVTLLIAWLKAAKMDWVVQKTTELGIQVIQPVICARSVPQPERSGDARLGRFVRIAQEASRQSGRADVPTVQSPIPFEQAIGTCAPGVKRIVAHVHAAQPIADLLQDPSPDVALAIGPEGGFTEGECRAAQGQGFVMASLGPTILRAETAAIAGLAVVAALQSRYQSAL